MLKNMPRRRQWVCSFIVSGFLLSGCAIGEPPTPGEQVTGPPIGGVLTAAQDTNTGQASVLIVGQCKKRPLAFGPALFPVVVTDVAAANAAFAATTAASIENRRLTGAGPAGCFSEFGGETLIITSVTSFNNTGTRLGGDISISVVEPKK